MKNNNYKFEDEEALQKIWFIEMSCKRPKLFFQKIEIFNGFSALQE